MLRLFYSKEVLMGLGGEGNKLRLVEEALAKIDEGTYGVCERCEEAIPVKRLNSSLHALLRAMSD